MGNTRRPPYVVAFKSIAFASFTIGLCLLSVCFWVLIGLMDRDSNSNDNPTTSGFRAITILVTRGQPGKGRSEVNPATNDDNKTRNNETEVTDSVIRNFKTSWDSVSPYFQGASGIAVILGLIQLISCMTILSSSSKGAIKPIRAKVWKIVNLIVAACLLLCVLVPLTIDKTQKYGGIENHLEELKKRIKHEPNKEMDVEDVNNMPLLYCTLLADAVVLILLVTFAHFVLNCLRDK